MALLPAPIEHARSVMFLPPQTPPMDPPVDKVRSLWEVVGAGELTQDEEDNLTEMLREMTTHNSPSIAIIVGTEEMAAFVLTITDVEKKNAIVATLFEAPHRIVTAIFKDWLVENPVTDDGFLLSDNPDDWRPLTDDFADKMTEIQDDEAAQEFAALVAMYDAVAE